MKVPSSLVPSRTTVGVWVCFFLALLLNVILFFLMPVFESTADPVAERAMNFIYGMTLFANFVAANAVIGWMSHRTLRGLMPEELARGVTGVVICASAFFMLSQMMG